MPLEVNEVVSKLSEYVRLEKKVPCQYQSLNGDMIDSYSVQFVDISKKDVPFLINIINNKFGTKLRISND